MEERDKTLDLGALDHRDRKFLGRQRRGNSHVGCLAKLASPLILAIRVDVAGGNDDKKEGEDTQS